MNMRQQVVHAPPASRSSVARWLVIVAMGLLAVALSHVIDHYAWQHWRDARVNDRDWGRLLRSVGYLPTWLVIAIGLWTSDSRQAAGHWRGSYVLLSPLLGGALAEVLKMIIRRLRPDAENFVYMFRPFTDEPFSTRGLGLPSSHVLVAFAGAAALSRVFPGAWPLWYLLAAGCAATRVLALGHFLSDVVTAALLGWLVGALLAVPMLRHRAVQGQGKEKQHLVQ